LEFTPTQVLITAKVQSAWLHLLCIFSAQFVNAVRGCMRPSRKNYLENKRKTALHTHFLLNKLSVIDVGASWTCGWDAKVIPDDVPNNCTWVWEIGWRWDGYGMGNINGIFSERHADKG